MNNIIVLKFGSSVLRGASDLPAVVQEVYRWYRTGARVLAVVSAPGTVTETLLKQARELSPEPEPWATAELLATGERASTALLAIALNRSGMPARLVNPSEIALAINGDPLEGNPVSVDRVRVDQLLADHPVLVIPGFFGSDAEGRTQLLGRGGSDLTAVFLSHVLGARCRLLKDVDGVYEADPANVATHPRRFSQLNYTDALRVAGRLIQPKALLYIQRNGVACEVAALGRAYQTIVHGAETRTAPCNRH